MQKCFIDSSNTNAILIQFVASDTYSDWLSQQDLLTQNLLKTTNFKGEVGTHSLLFNSEGKASKVIMVTDNQNFWGIGALPFALPEGDYYLEDSEHYNQHAIAWGLGAYQFEKYKKSKRNPARLVLKVNHQQILNTVTAVYLVRDLINTPTEDMGPTELASSATKIAKNFDASINQIVGDDLLKQNFANIHTVGRASDDAPRLIDLRWGNPKHPLITLIGKGVCFDTGGLDLKNAPGMLLMKKDMGGAAHVLALAQMIMSTALPIQLRVLIPAVENAVNGNAYRPGDVIKSRKGLTIEIGNTDAEGRLVLADALTAAAEDNPTLIIDFATLTGAARVALGTELPAMFCNDDTVANDLLNSGTLTKDYLWRMPLFDLYRDSLNSAIADINNCGFDSYGGAITAALFLKEFVPKDIAWVHFDLMAWNLRARPGRPVGGEAMGLRAVFHYLANRFPLTTKT